MKECLKCKKVKCQLCEKHTQLKNTLIIKNKINGKELRICKECGKEFNWI
ncbi:mszf55-1 [Clostridium sp. MSJ-11]|uniref:Mszf55-1 n=1 Tax=Clostridium mobile TaxID=2841512 RepID=A0ABS6EPV6_9CLOT|nr:mszf55-1 [Clostridium mobile]MBU5486414.1 mszf55-1 [Clostridium mobile]